MKVRLDVSEVLSESNPSAQMLIDAGANVGKNTRAQMTPLHYAARIGSLEIVDVCHLILSLLGTHSMPAQILLDNGASKTAKDIYGRTPYDAICVSLWTHCSPLAKLLLGLLLHPDEHFY